MRRLVQQKFRVVVGNRCKWRCVLSGTDIPQVLDAAHLPGRDWQFHNESTDGILIRADLHRLLDSGLAEIRDGFFWVSKASENRIYAEFSQYINCV